MLIFSAFLTACQSTAKPNTQDQPNPWTLEGGNIHGPGDGFNGWSCSDGSRALSQNECYDKTDPAPHGPHRLCWDGSWIKEEIGCPPRRVSDSNGSPCWDGTWVFKHSDCPMEPKPVIEEDTPNAAHTPSNPVPSPRPVLVDEIPTCIDGTLVFDYSTCAKGYSMIAGEQYGVCWDKSVFRLSDYENDAQCPSDKQTYRRLLELKPAH